MKRSNWCGHPFDSLLIVFHALRDCYASSVNCVQSAFL